MYVPEALAATVYLNMQLADTVGDPTATHLGLMPLFRQTAAFYKMPAHAALYHHTTDLPGRVTASVANIGTNLTELSDGRTVAHLINHNYSRGFQEQDGVSVSFPVARAPTSVTLVSARLRRGYAGGIYLLRRAGSGYRAQTCGVCGRRFELNYSAMITWPWR